MKAVIPFWGNGLFVLWFVSSLTVGVAGGLLLAR